MSTKRILIRNLIRLNRSFITLVLLSAGLWLAGDLQAATLTWTGVTGDWQTATNWNPPQVPTASDTVNITSGSVTNTAAAQFATLNLAGGTLSGTLTVTNGKTMNWTAGYVGSDGAVTVAMNGVLNVSGGDPKRLMGGLTNAGTVAWTGAGYLMLYGDSYGGRIVNLPGALFDLQGDQYLPTGSGNPVFSNSGILRKSAGSGTANFGGVVFVNASTGTLVVQSGTMQFSTGGNSVGRFDVAAGATVYLPTSFGFGASHQFWGTGTNLWTSGTITANGVLSSNRFLLSGATLSGTNRLTGVMDWTSGYLGSDGALTVGTDGVLNVSGGDPKRVMGGLTNAGTVAWTGTGYLYLYGDSYGGRIVNLPGALFDLQGDQYLPTGSGTPVFVNSGILRKSAGSASATLGGVALNNIGTVDVRSGTLVLSGGGTAGGVFQVSSAAVLQMSGGAFAATPSVLFSGGGRCQVTAGSLAANLAGTLQTWAVSGGDLTLNGTVTNLDVSGGYLHGTNAVMGVMNWTAGYVGSDGAVTVATNGVLNLSGSDPKRLMGGLTNAGTVAWTGAGYLLLYGGSSGGRIVNLAGALFDLQGDQYLPSGSGNPAFFNSGILRKSAGSGTTTFDGVALNNTGAIEALSGTLAFNGGYSITGGGVTFGFTSATDFGKVTVSGAAPLTGALGARLLGGYVPAVGAAFPVMTFGSRSGTFTDTNGLNVGSQRYFEPAYTATTLTLTSRFTNTVPPTPVPLPAGCVAWWRGENNSLDSAGTNHGTALNGATFAPGKVGQAFSLDGVDDMIDVGSGLGLESMTIETWVQIDPAKNVGSRHLFSKYSGSYYSLCTSGWGDGIPFFVLSSGESVQASSPLSAGWHHLAAVRNTIAHRLELYVDGVLAGSVSASSVGVIDPPAHPVIGGVNTTYSGGAGRETFAGLVDEMAIYNRPLSSNEIAAIYAAGSAGKIAPQPVPLPANCVAWWRAENNFLDSAGTNHGSGANGLTFSSGEVGQAFQFGGSNYVLIPDSPQLRPSSAITTEGWVKLDALPSGTVSCLIGKNPDADVPGDWWLHLTASGQLYPLLNGGGIQFIGSTSLQIGQWYHFAMTYDGAQLKLYVNGALDGSVSGGGLIAVSANNVRLGAYGPTGGSSYKAFLKGALDEVAVYDRALSSNEVAAIYAAGSAGKVLPATAPAIAAQPQSVTNVVGGTANFTVTATGTAPLSYQWRKGGAPLANGGNVSGATSNVLTLTNIQLADASSYTVVVSNSVNSITSAVAVLTVTNPAAVPLPAGCVAWWKGEGNVNDSVSTNHGTVIGGVSFEPGLQGQGIRFSGTGSGLAIGSKANAAIDSGSGLTFEAWIKPDSIGTWPVFEWGGSTGPWLWSYGSPAGALRLGIGPGDWLDTGFAVLQVGTFQHLAFTFDRVSGAMKVFRNGVAVVNRATTTWQPLGTNELLLGLRPGTAFPGVMDEITLYSRALSSNEIAAIYAAGSAGKVLTATAPAITAQPQSVTNAVGTTVQFTVTATGTAPLAYQWRKDGVPLANGGSISGATSNVLTLANIQLTDMGNYTVVVTNTAGSITSAVAVLTVTNPVAISLPANCVAWWRGENNFLDSSGTNHGYGSNGVAFAAGAVGQGFSFNGSNFVSVPSPLASVNPVVGQAWTAEAWVKPGTNAYMVIASRRNSSGSYAWSQEWSFAIPGDGVGNPLQFVIASDNAADQVQSVGNVATGVWTHVAVVIQNVGGTASGYAFYTNGVDAGRVVSTDQAIGSVLTDGPLRIGSQKWRELSSDSEFFIGQMDELCLYNRALSSNEIAAIYAAGSAGKVLPTTAPAITAQPQSRTNVVGEPATFSVTATGSAPLSYQWRQGGTNLTNGGSISGATTATLSLSSVDETNQGDYTVVITNAVGATTSSPPATLTIWVPPSFELSPQSVTNQIGSTALFQAAIYGTRPVAYQWFKDGVKMTNGGNISGVTGPRLSLTNVQFSDQAGYTLVVTNIAGSVTSAVAVLTVINPAGVLLPANCVAWWRGEGNGLDAIGTNHGTLMSGATFASGEVGQSFAFDGVNNLVSVPHAANLSFGGLPMTIEFWAYRTSSDPVMHLVAKRDNCGSLDYQFALGGASPGLGFCGSVDGAWSGLPMPMNTWVHLAGTSDGTTLRTYLNGQLVASAPGTLGPPNVAPLTIGRAGSTCGASFGGRIDELAIYNRALSSNEIAAIYAAGSLGKTQPATAPAIVAQPQGVTNLVGDTAAFTVMATGSTPLSYQWRKGGVPLVNGGSISGATSNVLTLANVQLADAGSYTVVVTNAYGSRTSAVAVLQPRALTVIFAENFDAGTIGQSLGTSPFNWTLTDGDVRVSTNTHPGWTGKAVVGALTPGQWGVAYYPVANIPTNGVVKFSFDAWAYTLQYGAFIGLTAVQSNQAEAYVLGPWFNNNTGPVWFLDSDSSPDWLWGSPNPFMREVTVHCAIFVDFDRRRLWAQLNDGVTNVITPESVIPNDLRLTGLELYEDGRASHVGADFDNLKLEASIPSPPPTVPLPANCIAWWRAENNFLDSVGTSHGSGSNGVTFATGKVGQGFSFPGSNFVTVASADPISPVAGQAWSAEGWVRPTVVAESMTIVSKMGVSAPYSWSRQWGFNLGSAGTGNPLRFFVGSDNAIDLLFSSGNVEVGTWSHVAVVVNNVGGPASGYSFYINGVDAGRVVSLDQSVGPIVTDGPLKIGSYGRGSSNSEFFVGQMDEFAFYNRALSSNEIAAIYAAGSAGKVVSSGTTPSITSQPQSRTNAFGTVATFAVTATGTAPLSYQWCKGGSPLSNTGNVSGATESQLTITNVAFANAGNYDVVVSNLSGSVTSAPVATLTVTQAVAGVSLNGLARTYNSSAQVVTATTTPAGLPYTVTYNGSPTAPTNAGSYAVVATITDPGYTGGTNGTLVIDKATQTITFGPLPPKVIGDPPFTLNASVGGVTLLSGYSSQNTGVAQVSGNTVTIVGAGSTLITATKAGDTNHYAAPNVSQTLVVSGLGATITQPPAAQVVGMGGQATFTVTATGTGPLHFQWYFNNVAIGGATDSSYTINNAAPGAVGTYRVMVWNASGTNTSAAVSLGLDALKFYAGVSAYGPAGSNYVVQFTTDLTEPVTWTPLQSFTIVTNPTVIIDYNSPEQPKRFYRTLPR